MFRTGRFNTFIVFIETNGRGRKLNGMILIISSVREIVLNRFFNLKSFIAKQQIRLVMLFFIKNSNKKKQETWRFVMESLNSCSDSGCHRIDADIKKKGKTSCPGQRRTCLPKRTTQPPVVLPRKRHLIATLLSLFFAYLFKLAYLLRMVC